jgi:glutamate-ammonia-ligase adenylyltransferase
MTSSTADQSSSSLADCIARAPVAHDSAASALEFAELRLHIDADSSLAPLTALLARPQITTLLDSIFGASPYLSGLIRRRPAALHMMLEAVPEAHVATLVQTLRSATEAAATQAEAMRALRIFKADMALLIALCDLGGVWPIMTVTRVLAETADAAVQASVAFLFRQAQQRGDWLDTEPAPEARSCYIVLAMGKHGAFELNYSSDIDLIVFFERSRARVAEKHDLQTFLVRLTRDLVKLMQERTEDGYVFRTDLRLRPDPGSTPVAISTDAAMHYYESFGQNWERAALIKARAIAGDMDAGRRIIEDLAPFIWRKYLDFAAIADIHAMKRQIHAVKGFGTIAVAGHNIKLGRGGIREIEFFAQTQQLIAGGRQLSLRAPQTLIALQRLVERGWIKADVAVDLTATYKFLREIEHRLQMIADEQTQTLPEDQEPLLRLAHFSGFADFASFSAELRRHLETVQNHYAKLFESSPDLTTGGANMVFAGEADDPATLEALSRMGYSEPATVIGLVRGWHHGRYPAIRMPRARELLTEVQPLLIDALAKTADPDEAIHGFDRFLSELPSGVQLFSLLKQNPGLLDLVASIMGTAPRLARVLSKRRRLLDAVLDPGFFGSIAGREAMRTMVAQDLVVDLDLQSYLDRARVIGHEQAFLIGVRVLTGTISADHAGGAYALLADQLVDALARRIDLEMQRAHGRVLGGGVAVIAMGKLGGREMTAASDLDLIVVYDFDSAALQSEGLKPLSPVQYYARLTQRLINAFTAQTAEGALYEVDMRLRPSGQKGPVATQLSSFVDYQANEAWTWEHMALSRARVVSGGPDLVAKVEAAIHATLIRPRDRAKITADVRDMRKRIAAEKGTTDIWDLKQVRGGLVDLEFITQHLQLVHAYAHPGILDQNTFAALSKIKAAGLIAADDADRLLAAAKLLHNLTQVLRLCFDGVFNPAKAPDGLKLLLAQVAQLPDFATVEAELSAVQADVTGLFDRLVN